MIDAVTILDIINFVQRLTSQRHNHIEVRFRTEADEGVLLVQSEVPNVRADYLVMAIVEGKVVVSYNLGRQSGTNLFVVKSSTFVNDGHWHVALLRR